MPTVNMFNGSIISKAVGSVGFQTVATPTIVLAAATLAAAEVIGGIIISTPAGGDTTLTLPTAVALAAALPSGALAVGSVLEFTVINLAPLAADTGLIIAINTGITSPGGVGSRTVEGFLVGGAAASGSGSGCFLLRCTLATAGAETFVLYRKS